MKIPTPSRAAIAILAILSGAVLVTGCASSSQTYNTSPPVPYRGPAATSGGTISDQLRVVAPLARKNVVFTVGECDDLTGQYKGSDEIYSRAVTQGCRPILYDTLMHAGFSPAERDLPRSPGNFNMIASELKFSHTMKQITDASGKLEFDPKTGLPLQENIGLLQHGGPSWSMVGANYMVTGAIVSYSPNTHTGGGGIDRDGIGASVNTAEAVITMNIRIIDMSTGLDVFSTLLTTKVTGTSVDFHLTRIIGEVASSAALVTTGGATSAVLQPVGSGSHVWQGEIGGAVQLPVDYAVIDMAVAGLARGLEERQDLFYDYDHTAGRRVAFDYNTRSTDSPLVRSRTAGR